MTTPWTALEGTESWESVRLQYSDSRRKYHDFQHILDMYHYADELGFEYDEVLDYAILFHDIIYDHLPLKETRSIIVVVMSLQGCLTADKLGEVAYLIGTTFDHSLKATDLRLVLLDLYSFSYDEKTKANYNKIVEELKLLYPDYHIDDLKKMNFDFIKNLYDKMIKEKISVKSDFDGIIQSIILGMHRHIQRISNNV